MGRKKWYDKEFKMSAVKLAVTTDKPIKDIAEELGVSETAIRNWITLYGTSSGSDSSVFTSYENTDLIRMRRELKRITEERDILKKALGVLSRELP